MGMGFAPTWRRQASPLLHMTTLTTVYLPLLNRFLRANHAGITN